MRKRNRPLTAGLIVLVGIGFSHGGFAEENTCFESRKGASEVVQGQPADGPPNVECSETTGAVLWWNDAYEGTVPMGDMPISGHYDQGEAVVKPRFDKQILSPVCGTACHNGEFPAPVTQNAEPRQLWMHTDIVPDSLDLQHGRGSIWCLDCHHAESRTSFVDHAGDKIDFNQPQQLCGKCHGPAYRDWRDGVHGKRIGEWATDGKKRWFVCTECHDPHDVQQGDRNSGFARIRSEPPPILPKGMENADHERHHGGSHAD